MTESEKLKMRAVLEQQQAGWDYLKAERLARIASTVTKDVLPTFQTAFAYSQTLPPRMESGFTEFYVALAKGARKCST